VNSGNFLDELQESIKPDTEVFVPKDLALQKMNDENLQQSRPSFPVVQ